MATAPTAAHTRARRAYSPVESSEPMSDEDLYHKKREGWALVSRHERMGRNMTTYWVYIFERDPRVKTEARTSW